MVSSIPLNSLKLRIGKSTDTPYINIQYKFCFYEFSSIVLYHGSLRKLWANWEKWSLSRGGQKLTTMLENTDIVTQQEGSFL